MPRRHPDELSRFSDRFVRDVTWLELNRGYLWPFAVQQALTSWATFVRYPYRRLLVDDDNRGCGFWGCCDDPLEAREILGFVVRALPRNSARELRERLEELDDLY